MDIDTILGIAGVILGIVAIPVAIWLALPTIRKPKVYCDAKQGCLYRCLNPDVFKIGWGIIETHGKLRVSHKPVTVVDAELSYLMDKKYTEGKTFKPMGKTFPPIHCFQRVANDEQASMFCLSRQQFDTISLTPGGGEKDYRIQFTLGGNFAEAFSTQFFDGTFSTIEKMFIPMNIRFEYEYNGHFYWTKDFPVIVHPFDNKGWKRSGSVYIDDDGNAVPVIYS